DLEWDPEGHRDLAEDRVGSFGRRGERHNVPVLVPRPHQEASALLGDETYGLAITEHAVPDDRHAQHRPRVETPQDGTRLPAPARPTGDKRARPAPGGGPPPSQAGAASRRCS